MRNKILKPNKMKAAALALYEIGRGELELDKARRHLSQLPGFSVQYCFQLIDTTRDKDVNA